MHQEHLLAEWQFQLALVAGGWHDKEGKPAPVTRNVLDLVVDRKQEEADRDDRCMEEIDEYRKRFGDN